MYSFKFFPSNNKRMLNKDLTQFLQGLSFLVQSLRKALLAGWWPPWQLIIYVFWRNLWIIHTERIAWPSYNHKLNSSWICSFSCQNGHETCLQAMLSGNVIFMLKCEALVLGNLMHVSLFGFFCGICCFSHLSPSFFFQWSNQCWQVLEMGAHGWVVGFVSHGIGNLFRGWLATVEVRSMWARQFFSNKFPVVFTTWK